MAAFAAPAAAASTIFARSTSRCGLVPAARICSSLRRRLTVSLTGTARARLAIRVLLPRYGDHGNAAMTGHSDGYLRPPPAPCPKLGAAHAAGARQRRGVPLAPRPQPERRLWTWGLPPPRPGPRPARGRRGRSGGRRVPGGGRPGRRLTNRAPPPRPPVCGKEELPATGRSV